MQMTETMEEAEEVAKTRNPWLKCGSASHWQMHIPQILD